VADTELLVEDASMADPPSGTVTMLFSDIEGSTLLLQRLGPDYRHALATQRQVLRDVWQARGGREMGTEGDSFFVVFTIAHDAVAAALDAQSGLRLTEWPAGERVRVRIGLHTGEPTPYEDGYVGMDVHRAARVAAIANGGQVVLTDSTAALVRGNLPEGARLSDLGEHRLKDLATPEHLFEVRGPGDDEAFPPVRSLGTTSSLPQPRTTLVGRETDRADLVAMLSDPDIRLVTLLGPGGTGKTRLAIDVAQHLADAHPDGVFFVPLAAVTTADALWSTLADRLDLTDDHTAEHVLERVAHQRLLLVLDNLEQLPPAAEAVAALLAGGPRLRILATSRRPLHVGGEHEYAVSPLEVPEAGGLDVVQESAAVRLFCERAASVRREFALDDQNSRSVATICQRLDGLPLAIELAAARCKVFSPAALLARLDSGLDATSADVDRPVRQRSLRDTVSWSHDLLDPELQVFFRRLGAFPGTADLAAVGSVTESGADSLDAVADLVDVSLVRITEGPDGEPRILLLQTIRDFARGLLTAAGESDDVQRRHADHYAAFVEELAPQLRTPRAIEVGDLLSLEHDNIRAALAWSLRDGESGPVDAERRDPGVRICVALWWFWASQGQVASGRRWYARAAEAAAGEDSDAMARILLGIGIWGVWDADPSNPAVPPELLASFEMAARWSDHVTMAEAANTLAQWHHANDAPAAAAEQFERAERHAGLAGDEAVRASVLHQHARLVSDLGDHARARAMLEEALAISTRAGNERDVLGRRRDLADLMAETGDAAGARAAMARLVPEVVRMREPAMLVEVIASMAGHAQELGELRGFVVLGTARNKFHLEIGWPEAIWADWEREVASARETLGEEAWEAAREEGRGLTMLGALEWAGRAAGPATAPTQ
jgi:predicted ATPase/class 3 adenylate cyclase